MEILSAILEIIKYLIPAVIVYFLMNKFLKGQQNIEQLKLKVEQSNDTLPLRFQAYERLTLFLERIKIPNLVMRLMTPSSAPSDLKNALVISIQKEYEHNLTQQIYVSPELWKIITLAKDSTIQYISELMKDNQSLDEYAQLLVQGNNSHMAPILNNAQNAIKKEVELYFK